MHFSAFLIHFSVFLIHFSVFLIHYWCINQSHMAYDVRAWRKSWPWSPLGKYVNSMQYALTTRLACTLSLTREYMEHGGRLPANCALTVYFLPVHAPYSDSNYGLCRLTGVFHEGFMYFRYLFVIFIFFYQDWTGRGGKAKYSTWKQTVQMVKRGKLKLDRETETVS